MKKWFPILLDALTSIGLFLAGIVMAGVALLMDGYAGPPSADDRAETIRLVLFGASLVLVAFILPLRSEKRMIIAGALVSITALLVLILGGWQPDTLQIYLTLAVLGVPLYYLRRHYTRRT